MSDGASAKVVKGMAWNSADRVLSAVISFALGLVLARMLSPSDYGLVALLYIFFAIANSLADSGFGTALIRKKDRTDEDCSTAFLFNMAASLLLAGAFFLGAPLVAKFYGEPRLVWIMRVSAMTVVLNGLSVVQSARLTVKMDFRSLAVASVGSVILGCAAGIVFAYLGYGCWALVAMMTVSAVARMLAVWGFSRWLPKFAFSMASFRSLFGFGMKITLAGLVHSIYSNIHGVLIGRFFSVRDLGLYNRGAHFAQIPGETVGAVMVTVNYPLLADIQDENERLRVKYASLMRHSMFAVVPVVFGLAAVAEPMVECIIGRHWLACCKYLQIMALAAVWEPMTKLNLNLLYVKGRSDLVLKLEIAKKAVAFTLLFALLPFGIVLFCWGSVAYALFAFFINSLFTGRHLGLGFLKQLKMVAPILACGAAMVAATRLAMMAADGPWVRLALGVGAGMAVYLALAAARRDESLATLWRVVRRK